MGAWHSRIKLNRPARGPSFSCYKKHPDLSTGSKNRGQLCPLCRLRRASYAPCVLGNPAGLRGPRTARARFRRGRFTKPRAPALQRFCIVARGTILADHGLDQVAHLSFELAVQWPELDQLLG